MSGLLAQQRGAHSGSVAAHAGLLDLRQRGSRHLDDVPIDFDAARLLLRDCIVHISRYVVLDVCALAALDVHLRGALQAVLLAALLPVLEVLDDLRGRGERDLE